MKPNRRFFTICLAVLAFILLAYGLLRMKFGAFLPPKIDENLPNAVIVGAVGILLWNRKLRNDAEKAAAEKKRLDEEAAVARQVAAADTAAEDTASAKDTAGSEGEGGPDAP